MYEWTELFLYKIIFAIEIFVAIHLFSQHFPKKKNPVLRYILSFLGVVGIAFLIPLFEEISYTWWYSSLLFLVIFSCAACSMLFIYDISWRKMFFISITSYTIQHLSHEIYRLAVLVLDLSESPEMGIYGEWVITWLNHALLITMNITIFVFVYSIFYSVLKKKIQSYENMEVQHSRILLMSGIVLFADILLNSFVIYVSNGSSKIYSYTICLYNILCCIMIFFIQFSMLNNKKNELKLQMMTTMLKKAEERYQESKENVDLINMKCHDLRHQIREFGKKGSVSPEVIASINEMVNIYDANVKTRNESIDLILSEKSLLCQRNHIRLTCLADASKLSFISDTDLYSLFGNALDNAIEAVLQIKEEEKRSINVVVRNVGNYLSISIENYFEGNLVIGENGLPLTTKEDKNYHGFGMKSIAYIVEKYHGTWKISTKKDVFSLFILFQR